MNQEGSDYLIKLLVKNVTRDRRSGHVDYILCGFTYTWFFNLPVLGMFKLMQNTHSCEYMASMTFTLSDISFQDCSLVTFDKVDFSVIIISNASFQNTSLSMPHNFQVILHNTMFQYGSSMNIGNTTIQGSFLYQKNTDKITFSFYINLMIDENAYVNDCK